MVKKKLPNSKRREIQRFDDSRVSHLRRLISSGDTGNWLISGSNHVLHSPTLARPTRRHGQPASATDHRVPECTDRGSAEEAGKDLHQSWSFCGEGARSVETDTELLACGPIRPSTFGQNHTPIRLLTPDCQTAFPASRFFDPTANGSLHDRRRASSRPIDLIAQQVGVLFSWLARCVDDAGPFGDFVEPGGPLDVWQPL
jgi:hypothetical protein